MTHQAQDNGVTSALWWIQLMMQRGLSIKNMHENGGWMQGPGFLWQHEKCWPERLKLAQELTDDPEVKRSLILLTLSTDSEQSSINRLVPMLILAPVWKRELCGSGDFIMWLRAKECRKITDPRLSVFELRDARLTSLQQVQWECNSDELKSLTTGKLTRHSD